MRHNIHYWHILCLYRFIWTTAAVQMAGVAVRQQHQVWKEWSTALHSHPNVHAAVHHTASSLHDPLPPAGRELLLLPHAWAAPQPPGAAPIPPPPSSSSSRGRGIIGGAAASGAAAGKPSSQCAPEAYDHPFAPDGVTLGVTGRLMDEVSRVVGGGLRLPIASRRHL